MSAAILAERIRRALYISLGVLLLSSLLPLFLRSFARSILFPGCSVSFSEMKPLSEHLPRFETVAYQALDNHPLQGAWFFSDKNTLTVLVFHGNAESAAQNLPFAADLFHAGFNVFLAEYRGYGGLTGSPSEEGLYADGAGAVQFVREKGVHDGQMILYGRSLGTGVAAELATRRNPALVLLVSPYTSIVEMGKSIAGPLADWAVADRFDTLSKLCQISSPVVILHGTLDEVIPVEMGRRLAASRKGTDIIEIPEGTHNDIPGLLPLVLAELRKVDRKG